MARAIWTGSLSFGLVNVPVGLYAAIQEHEVRFHQFQRGTSSRIRYRRVNQDTGEEVPYEEIVKGAEVDGGQYVVLTREELEQVEPGRSRTIDITDFVDASEIDPIHFQRSYYLAPRGEGAGKAYALLSRALEKAGRTGVATFVMRNKEYLAALRARDGVLVLETMFFADEVRDPVQSIDTLPVDAELAQRDVDTAVQLIDTMTTEWDVTAYRDTYTERVEQLIAAKRRDEEPITEAEQEPKAGKVVDLLDALQASVEQASEQRQAAKGRSGSRRGATSQRTGTPQLADLSKAELYEMAQELDVPRRSSMNREQLLAAVQDAGEEQRAAS
jgi:DNA end-binding protein Ku